MICVRTWGTHSDLMFSNLTLELTLYMCTWHGVRNFTRHWLCDHLCHHDNHYHDIVCIISLSTLNVELILHIASANTKGERSLVFIV